MTDSRDAWTIVHQFADRVQRDAERVGLYIKRGHEFESITWRRLAEDVHRAAAGFAALGIQPGDRVAQLSENSYEWIVADLAVLLIQAVHVPFHASSAAEQIRHQLEHCGARLILVSNDTQLAKLERIEPFLAPDLQLVRYYGTRATLGRRTIVDWRAWSGRDEVGAVGRFLRNALTAISADSLATILYTSGTTGEPKGVMLSHRNLVFTALGTIEIKGLTAEDLRLSFLPLSHIFERTCGWYTTICAGSQLALAGGRDSILKDCATVRPTVINGVPYFYQQVRRCLEDQGVAEQPGALQRLLGGCMRDCNCGGAPLAESLYDFYDKRGIPLLQGYGQTEASPVIATSSSRQNRRGAVGRPLPGTELRIAADGEVLTRGPHVMLGYWRDPTATANVLRDGWLHTTDLGQIDGDGFLRITGRKTERMVLTVGKNVAPAHLEAMLIADPFIEQAMIVGDGRNYLTALIVPQMDRLRDQFPTECAPTTDPAFLDQPAVRALVQQRIDACLAGVAHHEQVRDFILLPRPFRVEQGELTPKLSLRRAVILEHFREQIDAMYRTRPPARTVAE